MGTEIERKFLVKNDFWRRDPFIVQKTSSYLQGYILTAKGTTVRVRIVDPGKSCITIKGKREGISRSEFEYEIPKQDAEQMLLSFCEKPLIEKIRNLVAYQGALWEIDEFSGENQGLVVAEIELKSEDQSVVFPSWIGQEVSHDSRYSNLSLVKNPYSKWEK